MTPLVILLAIATFLSTLVGGTIILKYQRFLPFFFAFAAGSLMGVAFLDILPESLSIADAAHVPVRYLMITIVLSFLFYHLVERFFVAHPVADHGTHEHIMGPIGAGSLVVHSFLDGAAIGAAFQVSQGVGLIVALAVIFHDFTDGINTVTVMLKNNQRTRKAVLFLVLDALAPVVGVVVIMLFRIPAAVLAYVLAAFVGEFIYIGAANLLPETQHHPSKSTLLAMSAGILLIMALTSFI